MENFKLKLPETPITNSLDPDNKKYVEDRFPLTNDDTLREDLALKIITEADFMDRLRLNASAGEKSQEDIQKALWNLYESQLKLGHYIDVKKDLQKKTQKLIDELKILKIRQDIEERFKLQKSDISEQEKLNFKEEKINEIEEELYNISAEEVTTSENFQKILKEYSSIVKKYEHLYKIFVSESYDPNLN